MGLDVRARAKNPLGRRNNWLTLYCINPGQSGKTAAAIHYYFPVRLHQACTSLIRAHSCCFFTPAALWCAAWWGCFTTLNVCWNCCWPDTDMNMHSHTHAHTVYLFTCPSSTHNVWLRQLLKKHRILLGCAASVDICSPKQHFLPGLLSCGSLWLKSWQQYFILSFTWWECWTQMEKHWNSAEVAQRSRKYSSGLTFPEEMHIARHFLYQGIKIRSAFYKKWWWYGCFSQT